MMQDYCLHIRLLSPVGTPWHSDTIFGHLCWQVVFGAIDIDIDTFLAPFRNGEPPFILSDGFPTGLLPRPLIFKAAEKAHTMEEYARLKKLKKARYVTCKDFTRLRLGEESHDRFVDDPWRPVMLPHASPDRNTFSTDREGGFFETEAQYLDHTGGLDIYVRTVPEWQDRLAHLFQACATVGFGRDKSIGMGAFKITGFEPVDFLDNIENTNGFINLSSMVPAKDDPTEGWFRLRTKYGKLGEGIHGNPFKRPLLQIEPGAVFRKTGEVKPYYGRLIHDIAPGDSRVVQNGYTMVVPCRIKLEE